MMNRFKFPLALLVLVFATAVGFGQEEGVLPCGQNEAQAESKI